MSIATSDLVIYGCASRPATDTDTAGGAIDTADGPILTQISGSQTLEVLSDGADTRTVTIVYRNGAGVRTTADAVTLNATTPVACGITATAVLSVTLSTTNASRTVTLRLASAGATVCTIGPNLTSKTALFDSSASDPSSQTVQYAKVFIKNTHASLAALGATVALTADPGSLYTIGLAAAVNDTVTVANRLAAPAGISFSDDNTELAVPGTDLAAGAAIGVWIKQTLAAGASAARTTLTLRLSCTTVP